jgi:hypothetical protein
MASLAINPPSHFAATTAVRLADLIQPDGSFLYIYSADHRAELSTKEYNVLRHAGCVWVLNQAASVLPFDSDFRSATARALNWLLRTSLSISPQAGLCIMELGKVKLGASALAILAILSSPEETSFAPASPSNQRPELVEKLCDHMLAQITPDGDFIHKRDARSGSIESFRSDYYTGQALFALLTTLRWRPQLVKLEVAQELFYTLAARDYGIVQQSHWMMYAAEMAYILAPHSAIMTYAEKLAGFIIENPEYRDRQYCTPIACRSEALLAYLRILRRAGRSGIRRFAQARDELLTNLSLQLRDRLPDGAFSMGAGKLIVRIDYLQHNLAAFLGYAQFNDAV